MALFLGVDGGGSGCRAAVADASGRVLGHGAAGPANIWTNYDDARANVLAAARAALAEAGAAERIGELGAVLGLAGANVPAAAARLAVALPFARVRIESDAVIALRGAMGAGDGVAAALGTGSVFGVQRGGQIRTIGGWGLVLGDHGSGARLGRALCEAALLAHDGMAPGSALLAELVAEADGPAGLVVWAGGAAPAAFAALVPRLLAAAEDGDGPAAAILAEADAAVARAIDVLRGGGDLPVCFLGGLGPVFARRLAGRYGSAIRTPAGTALDGALAMAREMS